MYFCVNGRQPYSVLEKADEIKVSYEDREILLDFIEKIPTKRIILEVPNENFEWDLWHLYDEKFDNFCIALYMLNQYEEFNKENIKWYWPYPVTTYYELQELIKLNPAYILLGPPLTFDLDRVSSITDIPLRMVPNVARLNYFPIQEKSNGIQGQWIRPEDVEIYSEKISVLEFDKINLTQEEMLLKVYKEDKQWPGNLNFLIKEFYFNVDNRAIPEELGRRRMNCGQKCMAGKACKFCERNILFADYMRKEMQARRKQTFIDNN